jgi:hypothetical protein
MDSYASAACVCLTHALGGGQRLRKDWVQGWGLFGLRQDASTLWTHGSPSLPLLLAGS